MTLPSSRLQEPARSAVRFTVVGSTGTLIQYGIYLLFLRLFSALLPEAELTSVAFTIGFCLEMVTNYFLTSYYTFSSRPSIKNLGGFLSGRAVNYVVQILSLEALLFCHMNNKVAGFVAIVIAGIINYFVVRIFFRKD